MFGSSDKPDDIDDFFDGIPSLHGIAQAALHQNRRGADDEDADVGSGGHKRQNSRLPHLPHRRTDGGDARAGGGETGFRLLRWGRGTSGTPGNSAAASAAAANQPSFRTAFTGNQPENLEAKLNQEMQDNLDVLEAGAEALSPGARIAASSARRDENVTKRSGRGKRSGGSAPGVPPRLGVRPAAVPAGLDSSGSDGKSPNRVGGGGGGKFKAAVLRAMVAQRREQEAERRRGRKKQREQEAAANDHPGFIQIKDPALDKVCVEYGLTEELAEAKYRCVCVCVKEREGVIKCLLFVCSSVVSLVKNTKW